MSSENREEILASFQNITAIENLTEAIFHLDQANWDLLTAIHSALPQDNDVIEVPYMPRSDGNEIEQPSSHVAGAEFNDLNIVPINNIKSLSSISHGSTAGPSNRNIFGADVSSASQYNGSSIDGTNGSSNRNNTGRMVSFNIHYKYQTHKIIITDKSTVGNLKSKIMDITSIPICSQALKGWVLCKDHPPITNSTVLSQLNVARENELILTDMTADGFMDDDSDAVAHLNETYTLIIRKLPEDNVLKLNFPGLQTVLAVKTDVSSITDIPVRHQCWTGWPTTVTNEQTLAQSGIGREHSFELKRATDQSTSTYHRSSFQRINNLGAANSRRSHRLSNDGNNSSNVIEVDSESSGEEFEDASDFNTDDDMFSLQSTLPRTNYLIPDQTDDETFGCIKFVENYVARYGNPHPIFFEGNLDNALKEACHRPAKERKLLAIYLHHDGSVLTNVFCDLLLKNEIILSTLDHNFIVYGWDLTYESNKNLFLSSVAAGVGQTAQITARSISVDELPAILVIGKIRSICEVLAVITGNVNVTDLSNKLHEAIALYSEQREVEEREESERAAREMVKMEQDAAYNESLETDRRKEEIKRQKEHALASERQRLESERQEIEAIREANRIDAATMVPAEPAENTPGITKIRVRKPTGEYMTRRFAPGTTLFILLKFIASEGYPIDEYKVIRSYPREDLTTLDTGKTLVNLNLHPQETVTLEQR